MKKCKQCGTEFEPVYSTVEMFCSRLCSIFYKKEKDKAKAEGKSVKNARTPIARRSKKGQVLDRKYSSLRKAFLAMPENKYCFIKGCGKPSTTIEHRKGRKGFADDWAREHDVPLLIDVRFFAGCCHEHNLELETNSELSKEYQLSKIHDGKKI